MTLEESFDGVDDNIDRFGDPHREAVLFGSCLNSGSKYCENTSCPECDNYSPSDQMGTD